MKRFVVALMLLLPVSAHATEVQEVVSSKGVKAWLVEEHSLPLVALRLTFLDAGVAYDAPGKGGRATMASSLLSEGAGDMDATAFNTALESHAISMGFGVDADNLTASFNTTSEFKAEAFRLMGLALSKPRLDDVAVERVRKQMLSALVAQEKDPDYQLQRRWATMIFGAHPYANPGLGTPESVKALSKADLADFLKRYVARDQLVISVVGDITPEALKPLLDSSFGALPEKATPDVVVADVQLPAAAQQQVVDSDIPQTQAVFGTQGVMRSDPAFYDAYVMNYLLGGGGLSSRLFTEVREKRGLTYGISSNISPMRHAAMWVGSFATRNEKVAESLAAMRATLDRFAKEGPSDDELAKGKQYITGSFVLGLDSNAEIANYLMTMQINHLGRDYLEKRNGYMNAVTKEGVKAIAAKLADTSKLQVVMVGKPVLEAKP